MRDKSIELMNRVIADELSAIHQYMYFHFHCENLGYDLLASLFRKTAIEEMDHVERAAERALFLNGEIEMAPAGGIHKIQDVRKMLERAAAMEEQSAKDYNEWAQECAANADSATKNILEGLVADEERHFDQFTTEMENLDKFGDQYLALNAIERSKNISS